MPAKGLGSRSKELSAADDAERFGGVDLDAGWCVVFGLGHASRGRATSLTPCTVEWRQANLGLEDSG
jgi:hypothetical protein